MMGWTGIEGKWGPLSTPGEEDLGPQVVPEGAGGGDS